MSYARHGALPSFPTRRSSDLAGGDDVAPHAARNFRMFSACAAHPLAFMVNAFARRDSGIASKDRKSTRLNSSHVENSYAVFCLKKKTIFDIAQFDHRSSGCIE